MSIDIRFIDNNCIVREGFPRFVEVQILNAEGVASSILEFIEKLSINMTKLVGLGFDGTISGKDNGIQAIIRKNLKNISWLGFSLCFT